MVENLDMLGGDTGILERLTTVSGKILDIFQNPAPNTNYTVQLRTDELTSRCPATGHPDFCTLSITYVPSAVCVEMKSLKLYTESFRDEGHFYEELINLIYRDLFDLLSPIVLVVQGDFHSRGGWPATVVVSSEDNES